MSVFPRVPLGHVSQPVSRLEVPEPGKPYRLVGVRLWGQGAYERETIDGSQTKYATLSRVEAGDIVVNKIWARNGSVSVVTDGVSGCFGSNEFPTFVPDRSMLEPRWFYWITKTRSFWDQCDEKSRGTSGQNRIRPERFMEIMIPLPPLDEQRWIVARIEELAAKIETARRLRWQTVEELHALWGARSRQLFVGFKAAQSCRVSEIAEVRGGIQKHSGRAPGMNPRRYITVAHVQRNHIDTSDPRYFEVSDQELERWRLAPGDVLVIEGNGSAEQIGRAALFRGEIEDCVHQNHVIRVRPDPSMIRPEFLNAFFNSPAGREEMLERSRTTSGLFNLSVGRIKDIVVPVPSVTEQSAVMRELGDLERNVNSVVRLHQGSAAELDALLPALLDKAFSGSL